MATQYPNGSAVVAITDGAAEAYLEIPDNTRKVECWAATTPVWVGISNSTNNLVTTNPGTTGKANIAPPIAGACVCFYLNPGEYPRHSLSNATPDADGSRQRVGTYLHYKTEGTGAATLYVNFTK